MHMHMHKAAVCVVISVDMHRITTTPLQFCTGPSKLFKFPENVRPPPSVGG